MVVDERVAAGRSARNPARARLLVVDDDEDVRRTVVRLLESEGYHALEAASSSEVARAIGNGGVDLVLLDVMLGSEDGFEVLGEIRRLGDVPVIFLTAREAEADRVLGLRLGADDYVSKPFSGPELVARVATVLRRSSRASATLSVIDCGDLQIDRKSREVLVSGRRVDTTMKEFDLLAFLAAAPRQVFSREQLLTQVWGSSSEWQDDGTVTEHVRRVRRKLDPSGKHDGWIRTVRGVGYRFDP